MENKNLETFAEFLFKLIAKKNFTIPEVYHKAELSRKTFSDIRHKKNYLWNFRLTMQKNFCQRQAMHFRTEMNLI